MQFRPQSTGIFAALRAPDGLTMNGTPDRDVLRGGAGDDTLSGGGGHDVLIGDAGADTLRGGAGNDSLRIDADDVEIHGGTGIDTVTVATTDAVTIDLAAAAIERAYGNNGDDVFDAANSSENLRLEGRDGDDILTGGSGNDHLRGGNGTDTLGGGVGNDVLRGDAGADELRGGAGNDRLQIDAEDTVIEGGDGLDSATVMTTHAVTLDLATSSIERAYGNDGDDLFDGTAATDNLRIEGRDGDDILTGGSGNDHLRGGNGTDTLDGGAGNDVLRGDAGADELRGGAGNDRLQIDAEDTVIEGGDGLDSATVMTTDAVTLDLATSSIERAYGNDGDDLFDGTTATDNLRIEGRNGDDVLTGGEGNDHLRGGNGTDTLEGGAGNDVLRGDAGADELRGGAGNDRLQIDAEDTVIEGGDGIDSATVMTTDAVTLDLAKSSIERAYGNDGDDLFDGTAATDNLRIEGRDGDDVLTGGEGNDHLRGGNGTDTLDGGAGNDFLRGDAGADVLIGGVGNDTIQFDGNDTLISGGDGIDTATAITGAAVTLDLAVAEIERAYGNNGDDLFDGTGSTENLRMEGRHGNDTLLGGSGNDYLRGGDGADILDGGAGNDVLRGDAGADELHGGAGNDRLEIDAEDTVIHGGSGIDSVRVMTTDAVTLDLAAAEVERAIGNEGADLFDGRNSNEKLRIEARDGNDVLLGGSNSDFLNGGDGSDRLEAGDGNDVLRGGAGADELRGGAGNDRLEIDADDYIILGGTGIDSVRVMTADAVSLDLAGASIERAYGNDGDDQFNGFNSTERLRLEGRNGDDVLTGGFNRDDLRGGNGRDTLQGGDGNDALRGDAGVDMAVYEGVMADYDVQSIGNGRYRVTDLNAANGDEGRDTLYNVERIQFADQILYLTPNAAPQANTDMFYTDEDRAVSFLASALLANDVDTDVDPLTIVAVENAVNGTVSIANGLITFVPDPDFYGTASFDYVIEDGHGGVDVANVTINVLSINDAPLAVDDAGGDLAPGASITISAAELLTNDSDPDGGALSISAVSDAQNGTAVLNGDGSVTFTADAGYEGPATFTYTLTDGQGGSDAATVTLNVAPEGPARVNQGPIAGGDLTVFNTNFDTAALADGRIVTVWLGEDGVNYRFFNSAGAALGNAVVAGDFEGETTQLSVSGLRDGGFVISGISNYFGSFQRFDENGNATADGIQQIVHKVSGLTVNGLIDGGFAVTHTADIGPSYVGGAGAIDRYDADGNLVYSDINAFATINGELREREPFLLELLDGRLLAVYQGLNQAHQGGYIGFRAELLDEEGNALGNTYFFLDPRGVGDPETVAKYSPDAQLLADGRVLVSLGQHSRMLNIGDHGDITQDPGLRGVGRDSAVVPLQDGGYLVAYVAANNLWFTRYNEHKQHVVFNRFLGDQLDGIKLEVKATVTETGSIILTVWSESNDLYQLALDPDLVGIGLGATQFRLDDEQPLLRFDDQVVSVNAALVMSADELMWNDEDVDGDAFAITSVDAPINGAVVLNGDGTITFTPSAGFVGAASFDYTVTDSKGVTATETVSVNVTPYDIHRISRDEGVIDPLGDDMTDSFDATTLADGRTVTVWRTESGLFYRFSDVSGAPMGERIEIDGFGDSLVDLQVTGLFDGGFIVSGMSIREPLMMKFNADGTPTTGTPYSFGGELSGISITPMHNGGFAAVITTHPYYQTGNTAYNYTYFFNENGVQTGSNLESFGDHGHKERRADMIQLQDGRFIVAYEALGGWYQGNQISIKAQLLDSAGNPLGDALDMGTSRVPGSPENEAYYAPTITELADGRILVTSDSYMGVANVGTDNTLTLGPARGNAVGNKATVALEDGGYLIFASNGDFMTAHRVSPDNRPYANFYLGELREGAEADIVATVNGEGKIMATIWSEGDDRTDAIYSLVFDPDNLPDPLLDPVMPSAVLLADIDPGDGLITFPDAYGDQQADTITFGGGVTHEDIWFSRSGDDLEVTIAGSGTGAVLEDWFTRGDTDGTITTDTHSIDVDDIATLLSAMDAETAPVVGTTEVDHDVVDRLQPITDSTWQLL